MGRLGHVASSGELVVDEMWRMKTLLLVEGNERRMKEVWREV